MDLPRLHSLLILWQRPVAQSRDRRSSLAHSRGSTSILFLLKHMDRYVAESRAMGTIAGTIGTAPAELLPAPPGWDSPARPGEADIRKQSLISAGQGTKAKPRAACPLLGHVQKAQSPRQMPGQGSCHATAPLRPGVRVPGLTGAPGQWGQWRLSGSGSPVLSTCASTD